jgi:hypothetical protein
MNASNKLIALPASRIAVVPNAVDASKFTPDATIAGDPAHTLTIGK